MSFLHVATLTFLGFLNSSKYILIFLGCFFEGALVMMATGLLWHLGVVAFWPAYATLLAGDILADIGWYIIGRYAARPFFTRFGKWFNATPQTIEKMEERFHKHHAKILIVSKLTMGFGLAVVVLTVAGMLRVPFERYAAINIPGSFVFVLFLMGIGYYFGNVLFFIPTQFKVLFVSIVLVGAILGVRAITRKLTSIEW